MKDSKSIIEQDSDAMSKKFLKTIVDILSHGIARRFGLWSTKGGEVAKQMTETLSGENFSDKAKNALQGIKGMEGDESDPEEELGHRKN